jgi:hypothetical protein
MGTSPEATKEFQVLLGGRSPKFIPLTDHSWICSENPSRKQPKDGFAPSSSSI